MDQGKIIDVNIKNSKIGKIKIRSTCQDQQAKAKVKKMQRNNQ